MISAVDSSVLLDVLTGGPFAEASEAALRTAAQQGRLIVGECVVAEIAPALPDAASVAEFLEDLEVEYVPSSREVAIAAGDLFRAYLDRGGKAGRVVADLLIAAHARVHADRLIARDRGLLRAHARTLKVVDPSRRR